MTEHYQRLTLDAPADYLIKVQGRLNPEWSKSFGEMTITVEDAQDRMTVTTLTGTVSDQAALHGVLNHIRDLNLPLLLVEYIPQDGLYQ